MARIPVRPLHAHHHEFEYGPADYGRVSAAVRRVSWGAIVAGAVVALGIQAVLELVGLGVGMDGIAPGPGLDLPEGLWQVGSALVALFAGGAVAGQLAGMPRRGAGALHGLVVWALAVLLGATVGASSLGAGLDAARSMAGAAQPTTEAAASGDEGLDLTPLHAQAVALLADADSAQADEARALRAAIDATFDNPFPPSQTRREELAQALATATDLTEAQARETVGQWVAQVEEARPAEVDAHPLVLEAPTDPTVEAALWAALALGLGAWAAMLGAAAGTPGRLPTAPAEPEGDARYVPAEDR